MASNLFAWIITGITIFINITLLILILRIDSNKQETFPMWGIFMWTVLLGLIATITAWVAYSNSIEIEKAKKYNKDNAVEIAAGTKTPAYYLELEMSLNSIMAVSIVSTIGMVIGFGIFFKVRSDPNTLINP